MKFEECQVISCTLALLLRCIQISFAEYPVVVPSITESTEMLVYWLKLPLLHAGKFLSYLFSVTAFSARCLSKLVASLCFPAKFRAALTHDNHIIYHHSNCLLEIDSQ